jgi:hypothetical protein
MEGQKRFGYFRLGRHSGFSKVTRCKSETASGRYRSNGYVPNPRQPSPQKRICPQSQAAVTAETDMYTLKSQVSQARRPTGRPVCVGYALYLMKWLPPSHPLNGH